MCDHCLSPVKAGVTWHYGPVDERRNFDDNAELAKVPPNLRGTMTVYIVHKLWPEHFSPGVLLAPNPKA